MKKILFIVGSLREGSFNRQLAREAEQMIGARAEVTYLDYKDVPLMNQDIEFPEPESVGRLRAAVCDRCVGAGDYFGQFNAPKTDNAPKGKLAEAIVRDFGSFEAFKEAFQKGGATLFGSGWVWLSADKDGKLVITQEANAANPVQKGLKPLQTFDVWEHAYYLDYQNRRPDHLAALWQIIDWDVIEQRYKNK